VKLIRKRKWRSIQRVMRTTINVQYKGESIIGPITVEDMYLIARFGGWEGEQDWLLPYGMSAGNWSFVVKAGEDK
jgi:hypothetical protein